MEVLQIQMTKNDNYIRNMNFSVLFTPTESLELSVARTYSNMSIKYGNSITLEQYKKDQAIQMVLQNNILALM